MKKVIRSVIPAATVLLSSLFALLSGLAAMTAAVAIFIAPDVVGGSVPFIAFFFGGFGVFALLFFVVDALGMLLPIGQVPTRVWRNIALGVLLIGPAGLAAYHTITLELWVPALVVAVITIVLGGVWYFATKRFLLLNNARFFFGSIIVSLQLVALFLLMHIGEGTFTDTKPRTVNLHLTFFIGSLGITFVLAILWALRCSPKAFGGLKRRHLLPWSLLCFLLGVLCMVADRRYLTGLYPMAHLWLEIIAIGCIAAALGPWISTWPMIGRNWLRKVVVGILGVSSCALVASAVFFIVGSGYMNNSYFRAGVLMTASGPTLLDLKPTRRVKDVPRVASPMHHKLLEVDLRHEKVIPNDWNILYVTVDALRNDMLARPGSAAEGVSPTVAGLLNRCSDFGRTYAPGSRTSLSMGALNLGRYSANIEWRPWIWHKGRLYNPKTVSARQLKKLDKKRIKFTTLASIPEGGSLPMRMKRAGLHTMATVFCGNVQFFKPGLGFNIGYEDYNDLSGTLATEKATSHKVAEAAIAQIAKAKGKRWFQWIHFYGTHLSDRTRESYIERVGQFDEAFGTILDELKRSGQLSRTAVLLTADHGEGLKGEGRGGHASSVYDIQTRVPMVVCVPDGKKRHFDNPTSGIDATATALAIAQADLKDIEGLNLLPFVVDGEPMPQRPVFTELHRFSNNKGKKNRDLKAIVHGQWKLIHDRLRETVELYNMKSDPQESNSVAKDQDHIARKLKAALDVFAHNGDIMFRLTDFRKTADKIKKRRKE